MASTSFENVYNEVTHTNLPCNDVNGLDPMYHWDTHFPERLSKLHLSPEFSSPVARRSRKDRRTRNSARFKTQPITFDEIQEVDEETMTVDDAAKLANKEGLKTQFTAFSRSMDGLMPSLNYAKLKALEPLEPLNLPKKDNRESPIHDRLPSDVASGDSTSDDAKQEVTSLIDVSSQQSVPIPNLSDSARNRRQKRFRKKQRHNRSIEELPEIDKTNDDQAVR
ncbi:hypothetical protein LSH36_445g02007 [Paralvinella palmiformis]|uniref:Uncharacterized protein n=1 Tax=Paralvinella palmiformis TaxID=53620 RepID=A0AAD9MXM4_9ANNE|nr:hypothetical protein LSH36_445g02007 [Paralvinella palmiformis]